MADELGMSTHPADTLPRAFIVGCQKSGTSWMQSLLNAHPGVCCRGEACFGNFLIPLMHETLKQYNTMQRAGEINRFENDDGIEVIGHAIRVLQRRWVDASDRPVQLIAEKTPEHALALELLSAMFPQMRVIHIIRDGRDGVVSGWHHNIRENQDAFRARFPTMADYTRCFVEQHWRSYITRARQWGAAHPQRFHELRYEHALEHALEQPAEHASAIFRFLGIDDDASIVDRAVAAASFKSMSGGRDHGQVDNGSHMRRGQAGGWREELDDDSVRVFEELGGELLAELGYPLGAPA